MPFDDKLSAIADSMGVALYQRFTVNEASLFLRCTETEINKLTRYGKLEHIQVTERKVEYFGYQLLQYLLQSVTGNTAPSPIKQPTPDRILRIHEVREKTGLSRTTIWRLERKGDFPARVALSAGSVGWLLSDVDGWLQSRKVAQ